MMTQPQDKLFNSKSPPSESKSGGVSEQSASQKVGESSSESWQSELWHSTEYALVQSAYDGIRQDVNHLAGSISEGSAPLPAHQFVAPVNRRNDLSAVGIAQDVGAAIGTLPYFIAAQSSLKRLLPEKMIAGSLPLMDDIRARNVLRTAIAGGLVEGVLTPVKDDGNWAMSKLRNASTGLFTFAVAGSGVEYSNTNVFTAKVASSSIFSNGVAQSALQAGTRFAVGALSGGAGALVGNESSSLIFDHKLADGVELGRRSLEAAAMMATLSVLGPSGSLSVEQTPGVVNAKAADVSDYRLADDVPLPKGLAEAVIDESVPKPRAAVKSRPLDDLDPRGDAKQAARLERQAAQLAGKGEFGQSAQRLAAAVDCLEILKIQGDAVNDAHLSALYRRLSSTRMKADERNQPVPTRHQD